MATNLTNFRGGFKGTRPNRFLVSGSFPSSATGTAPQTGQAQNNTAQGSSSSANSGDNFDIYVKATQLPGSSIGLIPVAWQGRVVKFSGERTYSDWSIQVYDSSIAGQNDIRSKFEKWINQMNHRDVHSMNYSLTSDWTVSHVDNPSQTFSTGHSDSPTNGQQGHSRKIKLYRCFPIDLSPIDLSYDLTDTFSEFTVTLAFDYWDYATT